MIFYGSKAVHTKSSKTNAIKCESCQQQSPHTISIFSKYAHIYWIPLFPVGKKGVSECTNCKKTLSPKEMNEPLKMAYNNAKREARTPITHWSGLGIILLLIAFGAYTSGQHDKNVIKYIENPTVGDIYQYKPNDYYSLLKVISISDDSITLVPNSYEIQKKSKLYKINKDENYTGTPFKIGKNELKIMFESKKILDISRD